MAPSRPALRQTTLNASFRPDTNRVTKKASPDKRSRSKPAAKPTAKPAAPSTAERVQTDVLLAIKPVHLANIASQQKNHEYRNYRLKDGVELLWLYETGEGKGRSAITYIAVIPESTRHTAGQVPAEPFGIGNDGFNKGLKMSKYGYPILELYELVQPVTLVEMKSTWGLGGAPMGWRYVGADLWEAKWGAEQGRDAKLRKVF